MAQYEVVAIKPSGKEHDTYGKEYYLKLDNDDVARLWYTKGLPSVGDSIELTKDAKGYHKVKKDDGKWTSSKTSQTESKSSEKSERPFSKKSSTFKDNSLGMRIGMCINNASNYVNSLDIRDSDGNPKVLTAEEWAGTVSDYAIALFHKSDDESFTKPPVIEGEHVVMDEENPFK